MHILFDLRLTRRSTLRLHGSIIVVISPRYLLRGSLDIVGVLKHLDLKSVILAGPSYNVKTELPEDTEYSEAILSQALNIWFSKTPSFLPYLIEQILVALTLVRLSKKAKLVLFSHSLMPFPLAVSRLLRKKTLVYVGGLFYTTVPSARSIMRKLVFSLETLYYRWATTILVVASSLVKSTLLKEHRAKTFEASARLLDENFFARFSFSLPSVRRNIIGSIGRSSWEKGVSDFVASIPLVRAERNDVEFLVVGSDENKSDLSLIEQYVEIIPWVNDVENYLKKMKLLVIPSKSEGLPSVLLEAAASGTLVLATPVGGIGDFIKDGKSGFLLSGTSPTAIARRILEILDSNPLFLDKVSHNAYQTLKRKYDKEKVFASWRLAIENTLRT